MTLKVAAASNPATVAGAIANNVREGKAVELVAMGPNSVNQAVKAHKMFQRDKDYIVKDDQVVIIDEFTGRMMQGRRYSEGLHQAPMVARTAGSALGTLGDPGATPPRASGPAPTRSRSSGRPAAPS